MLNNLFWYFNLCDIVITSTDNWKASLAQSVERAAFNRKVVGAFLLKHTKGIVSIEIPVI